MDYIKLLGAWYERLSTFLLKHGYRRGAIDKTLFIKRDRKDIMLVQFYVDDIIFGSTKTSMVKEIEEHCKWCYSDSLDSDYARDNHDRRSTSGGCQYLGRRLVSWQCKKQTIVAISSTEAEYVAAATMFKGRTACKVWTLKEDLMLFLRGGLAGFSLPINTPMNSKEVATAVRAEHALHTEDLDINPSSLHSDDSSAGKKAASQSPVASERPASPNDYTPTDEVQTSGGDEGNLDLHGLTREVLSLKKQNAKQAAQLLRLKTKIKILVKQVKPVIAEYSSFVKLKATLSKKKKLKKAHKKKSSSFKQGRKKVSDGSTGLNEVDVNSGDSQMMDVDDTISAKVHEDIAQVNEGIAEVHEGTAEVNESTAGANLSTEPSMKEVEDEAGPSTFQDESDEFIQDDALIADTLVNISRPRRGAGITIPGNIPEQTRT
ncbi:hypothetical protein Tco_0812398 [Tanacetum coccineum]